MIITLSFAIIHLSLTGPALPDLPEDTPVDRPLCVHASHDQLIRRNGRDVCAPSVDEHGKARAVGFMPTTCPGPNDRLIIDAVSDDDVCRPSVAGNSKKGK
jgi:hypothetical protein